ncbi:MAG: serine hydrolase [Gammaproteobacteria bacterium]|nr:serine hydrolase [Gammaproteobacteria bacterium]
MKIHLRHLFGFGLCFLMLTATARTADLQELPVSVHRGDWLPLIKHTDRSLQKRLEQQLSTRLQWRKLIRKRKMAVGLVDLSDPAAPLYAQVNGQQEMYAASLPKIAILLAAFDHFEKGKLKRTPEIEQDLHAMIRTSSNSAATRMIDRLGGLMGVNEVLRDPRYHFYDGKSGGLWVGKRYAKEGPRFPDPVNGISHAASVAQVCRFYYQLATGRLISTQASRDMLEMLSDPGIEHKFVKSLNELAPDATLYRKSGTWKQWHADSVLVWGTDWRRYILVALVESPKGEKILRDLVALAENALQTNTN